MNSNYPGIKVNKEVKITPLTCAICGEAYEGVCFQSKSGLTSKKDEVTRFDVQPLVSQFAAKTLVYECMNCNAHVCANCIPKLKMLRFKSYGRFGVPSELQGHSLGFAECPSCKNQTTQFGLSHFYIVGRFPKEVVTKKEGFEGNVKFLYRFIVETSVKSIVKQVVPTSTCSLCMSNSVSHILDINQEESRGVNRGSTRFQFSIPLCDACHSVICDDKNIESPGNPVKIHIKENFLTSSLDKLQVCFVNPQYGELWLKENPAFVAAEFTPIATVRK